MLSAKAPVAKHRTSEARPMIRIRHLQGALMSLKTLGCSSRPLFYPPILKALKHFLARQQEVGQPIITK